ncbi:ABC-type transport system, involved in lipoprotein release, permease component [Bernardetia litoralis DSM 6794]|uniref:ABC-type transport system, involved in lipoprotein release, permease component n=1 Tax=Bernardetia litoralis (strain ATCC 23117 / DSM 6794 / NBRC 15988 / NCIMB 1366 / Fx l1 / Sio-4) TaxID=880071 RepID=I4AQ31_BERLS|nr:FtsX-like permease family protein [Bernardetia litoralis]AFM06066.1 ABC-type transport system, involved in lipoprotein release, permease component [Bernardetia litoralis DSM 6794]
MNILNYAVLSLLRSWQKQVSLIVIYALVVGFYASVVFFTSSLKTETSQTLEDLPPLWVQQLQGGRLVPMSVSLQDSISKIRGIKKVFPRYWGYFFDDATGAVLTVMGTDFPNKEIGFLEFKEDYNQNKKEKNNQNGVLVGTGVLETRNLQLGDFLSLNDNNGKKVSYEIVGSFGAKSDLLTKDLIILPIKEAQKIIGLRSDSTHSLCTDIAVEIYNPEEIENIGKKIDARFPSLRVVTLAQLSSTYQTLFSWRGGIFIYGSLLSVLAFLLLMWERASGLSSNEKKELGILKAIGWQINDVLFLKLTEGAILSITATLLGIVLAYVHVFVFNSPILKPFLIGWSVLYPAYDLQPFVSLGDILSIFSLSIVPYLAATLFPAWRGATTEAADAMR